MVSSATTKVIKFINFRAIGDFFLSNRSFFAEFAAIDLLFYRFFCCKSSFGAMHTDCRNRGARPPKCLSRRVADSGGKVGTPVTYYLA